MGFHPEKVIDSVLAEPRPILSIPIMTPNGQI